jgi:Flp pilus assembly protein TadD
VCALVAGSGCASDRLARCPARGGPEWRELVTDHFVVRTNVPARRAAKLAGTLERMRAGVATSLGVEPAQSGRVEVIAFRTTREFKAFAPPSASGYYLRQSGGPPRIVLTSRVRAAQRALLAHELTHHFLAAAFWRQPRWLSEGLAVYLESIGEDEGHDDHLVLGGVPSARYYRALKGTVPVRELLAWDGTDDRYSPLDYYASSWLLVHWLVHRRPYALADLQTRLAAGEDPLDAWRAALPDYLPEHGTALEGLDTVLGEYVNQSIVRQLKRVPVPAAVGYFERLMPSEEVHAIRLTLWTYGPDRGRAALEAEVAEALAEAPDHPIALAVKAQVLKEGDALEMARRSVEAYPGDPRAWSFLGQSLLPGGERTRAFRKAVEYAPENPVALHQLAKDLVERGLPGEAMPWARKAAQLAPWSAPLLATYARVLSEVGWCAQAIPHQRRALESLADSAPTSERNAYSKTLAGYLGQCRLEGPVTAELRAAPAPGAPVIPGATPASVETPGAPEPRSSAPAVPVAP